MDSVHWPAVTSIARAAGAAITASKVAARRPVRWFFMKAPPWEGPGATPVPGRGPTSGRCCAPIQATAGAPSCSILRYGTVQGCHVVERRPPASTRLRPVRVALKNTGFRPRGACSHRAGVFLYRDTVTAVRRIPDAPSGPCLGGSYDERNAQLADSPARGLRRRGGGRRAAGALAAAHPRGARGRGPADAAQRPLRPPDRRYQRVGAHPGAHGLGKGGVRARHARGKQPCRRPFIAVNCAAIPETLIESELFGYKPARSPAHAARGPGRIVRLGGTLFLDEIGDMPLRCRAGLLRVLEEREVVPLGSESADRGGSARARRLPPQPARDDRSRHVSRRPLLSAERHYARVAGPARASATRSG